MEENNLPKKPPLDSPDERANDNETKFQNFIVDSDEVVSSLDSGLLVTENNSRKEEVEEEEVVVEEVEEEEEETYSSSASSSEEEEEELSLSSRIIQDIQDGTYTCLVCTSEIDCFSKIWSCQSCSRVYDLDCVRDWALRGSSTDKAKKNWRCPACNIEQNSLPLKFTCWCGKVKNPDPNQLMPFSCGNPCNVSYDDCIHKCASQCHPAQHPVCGAMGPVMKCACGKQQRQLPCLITPYKEGWTCDEPCNTVICPSGHKCQKDGHGGCHLGFCGPCELIIQVKCYCGQHDDLSKKCSERSPKLCKDFSDGKSWVGFTTCNEITTIFDDCGIHLQDFTCQQLPSTKPECKYSPSKITNCPCGKTTLEELGVIRTSCEDPIPECESKCGKLLPCGCRCISKCHSGECICFNYIDVKCDCGHQTYSVPCKFIQQGYKPKCKHKCTMLLNCRKHYHKAVCCAYEQIGLKREREKKKQVRNGIRSTLTDDNDVMTMEPAHICTKTCNRMKLCGKHECEALCHIGPCGTCYESSNEDLICNCGKTIIPAPVRCGTKLECREQCVRPKECGHRLESHHCHLDSVSCPKCTKLVTKPCNCGNKSEVKNVLCSQENVSCGKICTEIKSCGHQCLRTCSESCTKKNMHASALVCQSVCHRVRTNCPHFCKQKCHFDKLGKSKNCDAIRCSEEVIQTCECGNKTKSIKCGASITEKSKIGEILECDEECIKTKRDLELRMAFEVDNPELLTSLLNDDEIEYLESTLTVFDRQKNWCTKIEMQLRNFVINYLEEVSKNELKENEFSTLSMIKKSLHFNPGNSPQRKFIHELASSYKLYSESQDPEPQRSVFVVATPFTVVPRLTLEKASRRRQDIINEFNRRKELKQTQIQNSVCNGILVQDVFFGITRDILQTHLQGIIGESSNLNDLEIQWMQGSTFIITSPLKVKEMDVPLENELYLVMKGFKKVIREKSLAFDCKLCLVDENIENVLKTDEQIRIAKETDDQNETEVGVEKELEKDTNGEGEILGEDEGKKEMGMGMEKKDPIVIIDDFY